MGNRSVREASSRRSVVQACHATRLRTGYVPGFSPIESSRTSSTTAPANTTPATMTPGTSQMSARGTASANESDPRMAAASTAAPAANAMNGSSERPTELAAYAHSHRVRLGGRDADRGFGAAPARAAGEPDQLCPAFTRPKTADPGRTSAPRPIFAPGASVLRAPIVASAPMRTDPMRTVSPSIHVPVRSTSGSIATPDPISSMPVTGGSVCRSTSRPIFAPSARA